MSTKKETSLVFFFQAEDGIRDLTVTGVQTCALPILPRRAPYVLKSGGFTPCSIRYRPAGLSVGIAPAGEMWSVVTESPTHASTRAPVMSAGRCDSLVSSTKNGGWRT